MKWFKGKGRAYSSHKQTLAYPPYYLAGMVRVYVMAPGVSSSDLMFSHLLLSLICLL